MNTKRLTLAAAVLAASTLVGCSADTQGSTASSGSASVSSAVNETPAPEAAPLPEPVEEAAPVDPALTPDRMNALTKAADYLAMEGFSRSGLIDQLKYEGFTPEQAQFGVDQAYSG